MKVWILADPASDGCLILRFQRKRSSGRLDKNTIAYLPCQINRKGVTQNEVILLGTLNFAVTHAPFCAPIILSDVELDRVQVLGVARSHILTALNGEMGWMWAAEE